MAVDHVHKTFIKHLLCIWCLGVAFKAPHSLAPPVHLPAHPRLLCLYHVGPLVSSCPGLPVVPRWLHVVGEEPAGAESSQGCDGTQGHREDSVGSRLGCARPGLWPEAHALHQ